MDPTQLLPVAMVLFYNPSSKSEKRNRFESHPLSQKSYSNTVAEKRLSRVSKKKTYFHKTRDWTWLGTANNI